MKFIKKTFLMILFTMLLFFSFCFKTEAKEVNVYVFYGKTCPHCEEALKYLNGVKEEYDLNIIKYEVWFDTENRQKMDVVSDYLDVNVTGVPFVIIDNTPIIGYSDSVTDKTYKYHINLASKQTFVDKVGIKLGVVEGDFSKQDLADTISDEYTMNFLMFKDINLKELNPFLTSLILGLKSSFSSCALLVLLILIFSLIGLKDKKKIIIIGIMYFAALSISYLTFTMLSIDSSKFLNFINVLIPIIAFLTIILGALKLNSFLNTFGNLKNEKKNKIKIMIRKNSLVFMIIGTIILGLFASFTNFTFQTKFLNLFSELISGYDFNYAGYLLCVLIYVISFMFFSLVIFAITSILIIKLSKTKKYDKYSKLVSGILMMLFGILLLLNPEIFMHNL